MPDWRNLRSRLQRRPVKVPLKQGFCHLVQTADTEYFFSSVVDIAGASGEIIAPLRSGSRLGMHTSARSLFSDIADRPAGVSFNDQCCRHIGSNVRPGDKHVNNEVDRDQQSDAFHWQIERHKDGGDDQKAAAECRDYRNSAPR